MELKPLVITPDWPKPYTIFESNHLGLPVLVADRVKHPEVYQYFSGQSPYRNMRLFTASVYSVSTSNGVPTEIEATAVLNDGAEDKVWGSYRLTRSLLRLTSKNIDDASDLLKQAVLAIENSTDAISSGDLFLLREKEASRMLAGLSDTPSREEYEIFFRSLDSKGVPLNDAKASYFANRYSHYAGNYWDLAAVEMAIIALNIRYGRTIPEPSVLVQPRSTGIPKKEGQLWEPCQCGNEPVYMPLNLCAQCWPR